MSLREARRIKALARYDMTEDGERNKPAAPVEEAPVQTEENQPVAVAPKAEKKSKKKSKKK